MTMMTTTLNTSLMKLTRRAEMNDRAKLVATFVDVGPLFTLLSNIDHQVMYGRRGTGKTHALYYLSETVDSRGDASIYIDMRTIGSSGGLYSDSAIPLPQRATRLLVDTLLAVHNGLFEFFMKYAEELDLSRTGPLLDRLGEAITKVQVTGTIQKEEKISDTLGGKEESKAGVSITSTGISGNIGFSDERSSNRQAEETITQSGVTEHRVHFGVLSQVLREIADALGKKRIWLLLDEWSSVPLELQPYLADLLRRSVFPVRNFTTKIASIEQRSRFRVQSTDRDYIGIELGADISADLNLDDFMVFENDVDAAKTFFQELLYRHIKEVNEPEITLLLDSSSDFVQKAFTQRNTFDEFVRATEGVPRDAINIVSLAAQKALSSRIAVNHINMAAHIWFQRDKEAAIKAHPEAHNLLHWIIEKVISERRARAFLFKSDTENELIDTLFDARVLHIMKRNISARDQPGIRYDVYELDYGCYVDLKNTQHFPLGLLPGEDDEGNHTFVDVPPDDYRAIRRAILDINDFKNRTFNLPY